MPDPVISEAPEGTPQATPTETQPPAGGLPPTSGSLIDAAAAAAGDGNDPNAAAPEAVNDLVGAPEGYGVYSVPENIQVDVGMVAELNELAKNMNLSQVGAQKLIDLQVKMSQKQDAMAQSQYNEIKASWETETRKECGANFEADAAMVRKTVRRFATPELLQLFADTGVGNHKAVFEFMRTVGKAIAEDEPVAGSGAVGEISDAKMLYGGGKK